MPKKISENGFAVSYAAEAGLENQKTEKNVAEPASPVIVWRRISELKKADYNARKISKSQRASLTDGMRKYGWAGSYAVINVNPERKDIIVSGHQRIDIWEELGNDKCPCLELNLSLEDERELNIRLNKNGGEFDNDLLAQFFEREELVLFGFSANELPSIDDVIGDKLPDAPVEIADDPVYPIVPKFNEKYSMFCIVTSNELDETWLRNVLRISKMCSYKSNAIAPSFVISCDDFKSALQDYTDICNSYDDNEIEVIE